MWSQGAEPGSLVVQFGNAKFSTKALVRRGKREEEILEANYIEQSLYVDGRMVFTAVDSTMDKVIRKGPDTIYKNTIVLRDVALELPSGPHRVRVSVKNRNPRHDHLIDPLDQTLDLGDVIVYPRRTLTLKVEKKRSKLGLGRGSLRVRD